MATVQIQKTTSNGDKKKDAEKKHFNPRLMLHIGKELYVYDSVWNGEKYIHIRELHFEDGKPYPTKKGVAFPLTRFVEFMEQFSSIAEDIDKYDQKQASLSVHLGGNWYVSIQQGYPVVNIRKYWLPEDATCVVPTKKGLVLTFQQFHQLQKNVTIIRDIVPELSFHIQCYKRRDHVAHLCTECNPNAKLYT